MENEQIPYRLFIDDERFPAKPNWFVARKSWQAIHAVEYYGIPTEIAFDHDLGGTNSSTNTGHDNAMNFVRWFERHLVDKQLTLPKSFKYSVHSANPVGAENIRSAMEQILEHFQEQ